MIFVKIKNYVYFKYTARLNIVHKKFSVANTNYFEVFTIKLNFLINSKRVYTEHRII